MEQDEKRFEYRFCCSAEENNVEEDNEGGIGVVEPFVGVIQVLICFLPVVLFYINS